LRIIVDSTGETVEEFRPVRIANMSVKGILAYPILRDIITATNKVTIRIAITNCHLEVRLE
jgi:hypothetical protein